MDLYTARVLRKLSQTDLQNLTDKRVWQPRISMAEARQLELYDWEKEVLERVLDTPIDWPPVKRFRRTRAPGDGA